MIEKCYFDNSTISSESKTVGKTGEQKSVLNMSTRRLHARFIAENDIEISLSLFRKMRPTNVLLVEANRFRTGLCESCLNVTFKAHAFRFLGIDSVFDKYSLIELSLCPQSDNKYLPECLKRECSNCGVETLKSKLMEAGSSIDKSKEIKWKQWKRDPVERRKIQVICVGTYETLVEETCQDLAKFPAHIHTAEWQKNQFNTLRQNLPSGYVVSVQDFAENYRHVTQNEISSSYYAYRQSSLFTNVSYYKCSECSAVIDESMVFITSDLKHDADVVKKATDVLESHLLSKTTMEKHIIYSDGCSAQFKSRTPFSKLMNDHSERHYFGSSHGKSACDGLGGIVKKAATTAVASDQLVISSTSDFYDYCKSELTKKIDCENNCHKGRSFFLLEDMLHTDAPPNVCAVPNTRTLHAMRSCGTDIEHKSLSCFCTNCTTNNESKCENSKYTGEWQKATLFKSEAVKMKAKKQNKSTNKEATRPAQTHSKAKPPCVPTTSKARSKPVQTDTKEAKARSVPTTRMRTRSSIHQDDQPEEKRTRLEVSK